MAKKKATETPAINPEVTILPNTPDVFLPVVNDPKNQLAVAVQNAHIERFVPLIAKLVDMEADFQAIDFANPTKKGMEAAKKLRNRYVREVRGVNKDVKEEAKKDLLNETNFIQGLYNTVEAASKLKEEKLSEYETTFEREAEAEKTRIKTEREALLAPYQFDTSYVDLPSMPEAAFQNMLNTARAAFEQKQLQEQNAELLATRGERLAALGFKFDGREFYVRGDVSIQQTKLIAEDAVFNALVKPIEDEIETARLDQEKQINRVRDRVSELLSFGMQYDNGRALYFFGDIMVTDVSLKTVDDSDWHEKMMILSSSIEAINTEAAAKQRKQDRVNQIKAIGYTMDLENERFTNVYAVPTISFSEISDCEDVDFNALVETQTANIARIKADDQEKAARFHKRMSEFSAIGAYDYNDDKLVKWLADAAPEKYTEGYNKRKKQYDDDKAEQARLKAADDTRIANEQKAAEEAKKAALAPDVDKLRDLVKSLKKFPLPECTGDKAKAIVEGVKDALTNQIVTYIADEVKKL